MKTIGLIGGVASGKSLVAQMLVELGAGLLDADRTGHGVLSDDADVHEELRRRWGDAVFTSQSEVDRRAIASRVFGAGQSAAEDRRFLEDLLHPRIAERLNAQRRVYLAQGRAAVVLDAPLLLEAGWQPMCDLVLMVDASRETRLARARTRGWSESQFDQREAAQLPVDEKRRAAHVIINNDGSEQALHDKVRDFWQCHVVQNQK
jgi:dephospho-CoA kinase